MKFAKFPYFQLAFFCASAALAAPERDVFDTDMGNDVDDALALAMLHRFKNWGKAEIAAVLVKIYACFILRNSTRFRYRAF